MNRLQLFRPAALLLGTVLACGSALAAPKADTSSHARYQQERAACLNGQTHQDRTTCLYEAQSAYDEARRGVLEQDDASMLEVNARKRCEPLPLSDKLACLARMDGQGRTLGSVEQGGIYRELVTLERISPRVLPQALPLPLEDNNQQDESEK